MREGEAEGVNERFLMHPGSHVGWDASYKDRVPQPPLIQSKDLREDLWATEAKLRVRVAPMLRQE